MNTEGQIVVLVMIALNMIYLFIGQAVIILSYLARAITRRFWPQSPFATRARLRFRLLVPSRVPMPDSRADELRLIDSLSIAGIVQLELFLILPLANALATVAAVLLSTTAFSSLLNLIAVYVVLEVLVYLLLSPVFRHLRYRLSPVDSLGEASRYFSLSAQRYRLRQTFWTKQAYATNLRRFLYVADRCGVDPSSCYVGNLKRTAQNNRRTAADVHRNINDVFYITKRVFSGDYVWARTADVWSTQHGQLGTNALKTLALVPGLALLWQVILGVLTLAR